MDAVKFLEKKRMMCKKQIQCSTCPLYDGVGDCKASIRGNDYKEVVRLVEEWAKNNPAKTRQSEFLKIFANAKISCGIINICPEKVDCMFICQSKGVDICDECRKKYWLTEVE